MIDLPRHCDKFLLLMSLDPRFYLSGGMFLSGSSWTPDYHMWQNFHYATFYYTAYDLTDGRFEQIGQWRYRCLSHLGKVMEQANPQAKARQEAGS